MERLRSTYVHFSRIAEKYLKTDIDYLSKGSFWLTVNQGIAALSGFLLSIAFANLLDPNTYGIYRYILSASAIFSTTTLLGINTAIARAIAKHTNIALISVLKKRFAFGIFGSIASLVMAAYYFFENNTVLGFAFLIIAIANPFFESLFLYDAVLQGQKDFRKSAFWNSLSRIVSVISIVLTIFLSDNLSHILLAYFIPIILVRIIATKIIFVQQTGHSENTEVLRYGKHLSIMGLVNIASANIDKILVFQFLGAVELAAYYFAMVIPDHLRNLFKNIGALAFPKFAAQNGTVVQAGLSRKMWLLFSVLILVFIAYVIGAPFIFKYLFPQYAVSVALSQVYAFTLLLTPKVFYRVLFETHEKSKELYIFQISSAVVRATLFLVFLPVWGLWGAIAVNIISEIFVYILLYFLNKRSRFA